MRLCFIIVIFYLGARAHGCGGGWRFGVKGGLGRWALVFRFSPPTYHSPPPRAPYRPQRPTKNKNHSNIHKQQKYILINVKLTEKNQNRET